jgi:hypothetical protein
MVEFDKNLQGTKVMNIVLTILYEYVGYRFKTKRWNLC